MTFRSRLLRTRWLTVLTAWALAFAALAPAVSHAWMMQQAKGGAWIEVCTAQGSKWLKVGEQQNPSQATDATTKGADTVHIKHCQCCVTDLPAITLPSVSSPVLLTLHSNTHPALFYRAPRPLFVWASAQSRAPPVAL